MAPLKFGVVENKRLACHSCQILNKGRVCDHVFCYDDEKKNPRITSNALAMLMILSTGHRGRENKLTPVLPIPWIGGRCTHTALHGPHPRSQTGLNTGILII